MSDAIETTDQQQQSERSPAEADRASSGLSRRQVVGGAVLMTLASRSAWGTGTDCVSNASWLSYINPSAASLGGGGQHAAQLAQDAADSGGALVVEQQADGDWCLVDNH